MIPRPMAPRVTLVASTYRSERFLPSWLDSMAAQTLWPEVELVVVANDPTASEDSLLSAFAAEHPQARVVHVDREPLYRSWNRAIDAAMAPLLAIANVDDLRTPEGLRAQVEALEGDVDALFSYGDFTITTEFPPGGRMREVAATPFERELFTRAMMLGPFFVWRSSDDARTRYFDEQLEVAGDFDLAVRLALHGRGVPVRERLGYYFDGRTGLSTSGEIRAIEGTALCLRYGIYESVDLRLIPQAVRYAISWLWQPDGAWLSIEDVVPDYEAFLAGRVDQWQPLRPSMRRLRARLTRS
jgi:glycosyltransferase involved in cell wall biosynthesis